MNESPHLEVSAAIDRTRLEQVLQSSFGPVRIARIGPKMNVRSDSDVARVLLVDSGGHTPASVVVKALHDGCDAERSAFMAEEALNYRFLALRGFDGCPRLLAAVDRLLVLEDVEGDAYRLPDRPAAERAVAEALARLHAATRGSQPAYLELRRKYGLPDDAKTDHATRARERFNLGRTILTGLIEAAGSPAGGFSELMDQASLSVSRPGWWSAFIHDDFASGRQVAIRDGKVVVLDFERGRFGHMLVDPARVLLGEVVEKAGRYAMYRCLDFEIGFLDQYARQLRRAVGGSIPEDWRSEFGWVLACQTAELIGVSGEYEVQATLHPPLTETICRVVVRASELLEGIPALAELRRCYGFIADAIRPPI